VTVWDADSGEQIASFEGHSKKVNCLAFNPDGDLIASASDDETVKVWTVLTPADKRGPKVLRGHKNPIQTVVFSPDGKQVATADGSFWKDATAVGIPPLAVKVWDATTGRLIRTYEFKGNGIGALAYAGDGRRLAAAVSTLGEERPEFVGELKIWDAATGQEIRTIKGIVGWLFGVAFTSDGKRIVSGSAAGMRMWRAKPRPRRHPRRCRRRCS
jgi:WD40 repeat protein